MRLIGLAVALTISLFLAPLVAEAEPAGRVPRVGVLVPAEPDDPNEPNIAAFRQSLRNLGYVDGQNIAVEYRYGHGNVDRYPVLAAELVRLNVDVIVVGSWAPILAVKNATQTIAVVGVGMRR